MKKYLIRIWLVVLVAAVFACNSEERNSVDPVYTINTQFETGTEKWTGDYALYNIKDTADIAYVMEQDTMPASIDSTRYGIRMEATNKGDSIFLFMKRKITGLNPDKTYHVYYDIDLGTNYPDLTNATGKNISLKAGASASEPVKTLTNGYYSLSIKKGLWNVDGSEMVILGDVTNGIAKTTYQLVNRNSSGKTIAVQPDSDGTIWLCVGEDIHTTGKIVLYYDKINVSITEQ